MHVTEVSSCKVSSNKHYTDGEELIKNFVAFSDNEIYLLICVNVSEQLSPFPQRVRKSIAKITIMEMEIKAFSVKHYNVFRRTLNN